MIKYTLVIFMAIDTSRSDYYNENIFLSLYPAPLIEMFETFSRTITSSTRFNVALSNAFSQSYPIYLNTISEYNKSWKDLSELDKILRSRFQKTFDEKFRNIKSPFKTQHAFFWFVEKIARILVINLFNFYLIIDIGNIFRPWNYFCFLQP